MEFAAKTMFFCRKRWYVWLGGITASLFCLCVEIDAGASGPIPLNTRLPVEEQNPPVLQEVQEPIISESSSAIVLEPDTEQELLGLLQSSSIKIDEPPRENPPVKIDKANKSPRWKVRRMRVTGYCACPICCGDSSDGITANMYRIRSGDTFAAADKKVPFGTRMIIPGYNRGRSIEVKDRGRLIQGNCLDLYFSNHQIAQKWGVKYLDVKIRSKD
jgi:3D (Asp-Asp-Asp) domain-containing protein